MSGYFETEGSKFKGRPLTTLPVVLNRDLSRIINSNMQLKSSHDLEHLRSIAQQRRVDQAYTVSYSEDSRSSRGVPVGALRCERPEVNSMWERGRASGELTRIAAGPR
ncbi:hypothetical protein ElyMa_005142700 [Elysia marginata]|uniref:SCP domain-containing protein n=1 Tax=Elysia marginata TaxID=1093978 RepID=A0AAV4JNE9_9GAST|nr:hypothetical protein ElyMa_005142700 [Elysia marginata]